MFKWIVPSQNLEILRNEHYIRIMVTMSVNLLAPYGFSQNVYVSELLFFALAIFIFGGLNLKTIRFCMVKVGQPYQDLQNSVDTCKIYCQLNHKSVTSNRHVKIRFWNSSVLCCVTQHTLCLLNTTDILCCLEVYCHF